MRLLALPGLLVLSGQAFAQFPQTRIQEVRIGQQRPLIERIAQDAQGLVWMGSDRGLFRTDGEQVELILRTEPASVTALARMDDAMVAALSDGRLVRCDSRGCDTLFRDPDLAATPVRHMVHVSGGPLHLGTYGAGVWSLDKDVLTRVTEDGGLPDDHVNGMCLLDDGRLVVATDQGLALLHAGRVTTVFGEAEGAPDNLVMSVATDGTAVWAGTDRHGPFRWRPDADRDALHIPLPAWDHGAVVAIAVSGGQTWLGTDRQGLLLFEMSAGADAPMPLLRRDPEVAGRTVHDLFVDRDGAAWWCMGADRIHRADPSVLEMPVHEGIDLRGVTALAIDGKDRIWFATRDGLYHHPAAFAEGHTVTRVPLAVDARKPIVSMSVAANGTLWAATFGDGVHAIHPDGQVTHHGARDGSIDDEVLVVRARGDTLWFGTLSGVIEWHDGRFKRHTLPGNGFIYDLLPLPDGGVLAATDGAGVVRYRDGEWHTVPSAFRTYYALLRDGSGRIWAAGPGTGLCAVGHDPITCFGAERIPFEGDLFSLGLLGDLVLAFGGTGVAGYDPEMGAWRDMDVLLGLPSLEAELNTARNDAAGALWLSTTRGLMRIRPLTQRTGPVIETVVTAVSIGNASMPLKQALITPHDRNDVTFRFTGLHYADPGALRFEVRLLGHDERGIFTRDREAAWSALPPGDYRFQVRAFTGDAPQEENWATVDLTIEAPWWRRPWVIAGGALLLVLVVVLLVRARERRLRERDRMEREQVRFQLDALRSQVDPHFLFNSFNALVELIETDAERAVEHVELLSTFFRNILQVRDRERITVAEELDLLRTYFALEQRRFGDAISLDITVGKDFLSQGIVPLTLQLLVENALKHNVITSGSRFSVQVDAEGDHLVVRNPIIARLTPPRSTGFGLESITKRYAALTARPVVVERTADTFTVRIPLLEQRP